MTTTVQVNVLDAKNRLSELLRSVADGNQVIIANRGIPVARLVALDAGEHDGAGGVSVARWLERHPLPSHARRTPEELDASIATEREAWE